MSGTNRKAILPDGMLTPFAKMTRLDKIAAGGFGDVYRAEHEDWGTVAYKKLPQSYIQPNDRAVRQMMREVEILKKLRHQNIVTITGVVFENGNYGIILEFMFHGNADNFFVTFRVPVSWKVQLVYDVVLGMNYLHLLREPIIHGDLKIQNILVTNGYQAKISDFGLSSWKGVSKSSSRHADIAGTVTHISPERWTDVNIRPMEKEDIYAFGVLVWEMFTEQKPFPNLSNAVAIMLAVSKGQRPDARQLPTDTPSLIRSLIESSWANDPSNRKTFKEIKLDLDSFISSHEEDIRTAKQHLLRQESMSSDSSSRMNSLSLTSVDADQERNDSGNSPPRDHCQTADAAADAAACGAFSSSVLVKHPVSVRDHEHTGPSGTGGGMVEGFPPSLCLDKNLIPTEPADPVDSASNVVYPVQESEGKPSSMNPPLTFDPSVPQGQGVVSLETNSRSFAPGSSDPGDGSQTLIKEIVGERFLTSLAPLAAEADATDVPNPISIHADPSFCAEREKNGAGQEVHLNLSSQRCSAQEQDNDSCCGEPLNFGKENLRTVLNRPFSVPETDATLSASESESQKEETVWPSGWSNSQLPQNQSIGSKDQWEKSNDLLKVDLTNWNQITKLNNLDANKGYYPKDGGSFKEHATQPMSFVANLSCPVGQFGDNETTRGASRERHLQPPDCSGCEGKGRQNSPIGFHRGSHQGSGETNSPVVNCQKNGKELRVFNASHVGPYVQFGDNNTMNVTASDDASSFSLPPSASSSSSPAAQQKSSTQSKERTRQEKIIVPDRLVDSGIMTIVAGSIGRDWVRLARELGICDSDIGSHELDHGHLGVHEIAYQMLRDWIERKGSEAKVQLIAKALVAIKRPDVALRLSSSALAASKH